MEAFCTGKLIIQAEYTRLNTATGDSLADKRTRSQFYVKNKKMNIVLKDEVSDTTKDASKMLQPATK